ncbi:MAG: TldD/PmbA family protein [Pseudomonadota bacterium]
MKGDVAIISELRGIGEQTAALARRTGAEAAEVLIRDALELTAKVRLGEPELVKESGSRALGMRVFVGGRSAVTYTSDLSPQGLEVFVADSVSAARLAEPDELNTLPDDAGKLAQSMLPELDLWDDDVAGLDAGRALEIARRGEQAAMKQDRRITNSDGAAVSKSCATVVLANSAGFAAGYRGTQAALVVEPICDDEGGKKRNGWWWTASRFLRSLDDADAVGIEAARRTVAKLGSRKVATCEVPVVFEPEAARALLGELFGVANGGAFYRRASYLVGRESEQIASPLVTVTDDPLIPRGPGSRPFDGEGSASRVNVVVDNGVLRTVLCDTYSARKLGRQSTGSAGRGIGTPPSPTFSNFGMKAGSTPSRELVRELERGLLVTEMMGFGFNPVTGDFSRGASGFWIEKGEPAFPVSEVTISANFLDLWKGIDAVGSDLDARSAVAAPSFRVARMTVAGY